MADPEEPAKTPSPPPEKNLLPQISAPMLRLFRRVVRSYFRRHFRSVMVQGAEHLVNRRGPLILYGNHSSWWDPMISILLAAELFPGEHHYAPIDARALLRYPILGRLGLFPVELDSPRGAVQFLRTAQVILSQGGVLWMTPQGRFVDPRDQTPAFRPGLGALLLRMPEVNLIPLSVEYTFWNERLPEALGRFGEPVAVAATSTAAEITTRLEQALATEMKALETASRLRNPEAFSVILSGKQGSGGIYGVIRRLRAWFAGQRFQADHTERPTADAHPSGPMQQ